MQNPLASLFNLNEKSILVTGASSGIGAATAQALGRAGARVALVARNQDKLDNVVASIREAGGTALAIKADVTEEADVQRAVATAVSEFGRLDGAFNNAGVLGTGAPLQDLALVDFDTVMRANVHGMFLALKYEMAAMLKTGGGAIVNNASIVAHVAFANLSPYNTSKHAVLGLTRSAALDGWPQGIRVNAVSPGPIETPMAEAGFGGLDNLQTYLKSTPAGRPGKPEEIAAPVLFLLSPASSYINAQALVVDGGFTAA